MRQKLRDADIDVDFTPEQTSYVERLGGRASDLESVRIDSSKVSRHFSDDLVSIAHP